MGSNVAAYQAFPWTFSARKPISEFWLRGKCARAKQRCPRPISRATKIWKSAFAENPTETLGEQANSDSPTVFEISNSYSIWDGALVSGVLASHQCDQGSIPGLGVICGLRLLLVLVLAFSPGTPVSQFLKSQHFQLYLEFDGTVFQSGHHRLSTFTIVKQSQLI